MPRNHPLTLSLSKGEPPGRIPTPDLRIRPQTPSRDTHENGGLTAAVFTFCPPMPSPTGRGDTYLGVTANPDTPLVVSAYSTVPSEATASPRRSMKSGCRYCRKKSPSRSEATMRPPPRSAT